MSWERATPTAPVVWARLAASWAWSSIRAALRISSGNASATRMARSAGASQVPSSRVRAYRSDPASTWRIWSTGSGAPLEPEVMDLAAQQLDLMRQFGHPPAELVAFGAQRGDGLAQFVVQAAHLVQDGVLLTEDGGGVVAVELEGGEDHAGHTEDADDQCDCSTDIHLMARAR